MKPNFVNKDTAQDNWNKGVADINPEAPACGEGDTAQPPVSQWGSSGYIMVVPPETEGNTAPASETTTRDFEGELLVVLQIQPRVTIERVLDIMAAAAAWQVEGRTATLQAENTRLKKLVSDKEPNGYPLWFNRAVVKCQRCDEEDLCRRHWEMAHADFKDCEEYVAAFIKELEATHE